MVFKTAKYSQSSKSSKSSKNSRANRVARPRLFVVWLRRVLAILLVLTYGVLAIGSIQLATIPNKYLLSILPIYGIITALLVWVLFDTKKLVKRKIVLGIVIGLSSILIGINSYVAIVLHSASSFLGGIQGKQSRYVEYSIITSGDKLSIVESDSRVSIITSDPLYHKASVALGQETPAKQQSVEHLAHIKNALVSKQTELSAVRTESLQILKEEDPDFFKTLSVVRTFLVEQEDIVSTKPLQADRPYAIYISGIDTYGDISATSRSDVNILIIVDPAKRKLLTVNTPRDYYVQLHGTVGAPDKLTHAGIYGVDMSRQTIADLYGIDVPYYARINFTSLVNVINTIGPIDVYSDVAFGPYEVGYNSLDSKQALAFSRERKSFEAGDRQRGRNQQRVIEAIIAKMSRTENSVKMPQILGSVQSSIETNISEASMRDLIRNQLDDIRGWSVESIAVDGSGSMLPTYSYGNIPLYVMIPDQASIDMARQKISSYLGR